MQKYAAIDIETTGLDPERGQVLELACVIETDWATPVEQLPTFRRLVSPADVLSGDPKALAMNARLIAELAANPFGPDLYGQLIDLGAFLAHHLGAGAATIAGKNFGAFDYQFLRRSAGWKCIHHKHRFIDPAMLWWRPKEDVCLPDLATCVDRARTPIRSAHDAVADCRSVIEVVRAYYRRYSEAA